MRTVSATEASRGFAALLDEVEAGETLVITRAGRRVATIGPADAGNGSAFIDLILPGAVDIDFARDVEGVREIVTEDVRSWPAG